jgi:hypothetical protein
MLFSDNILLRTFQLFTIGEDITFIKFYQVLNNGNVYMCCYKKKIEISFIII